MATAPTVHIIGFGSIGGLIGVHLQCAGIARVVPVLSSPARAALFHELGSKATLDSVHCPETPPLSAYFPAAVSTSDLQETGSPIDHLVITCKAQHTLAALRPVWPLLHNGSTIALLQNGLGVAELLRAEASRRGLSPTLFQGVVTHGAHRDSHWNLHHAGKGQLLLACLPRDPTSIIQAPATVARARASPLAAALLRTPLDAALLPYQQLLPRQLEKLVVNACINPLSALLDCPNGALVPQRELFAAIAAEAAPVLRSAYSALFSSTTGPPPADPDLLAPERLSEKAAAVAVATASNSSSTREDVRAGRTTEIDFINGYIVDLAAAAGLPASAVRLNRALQLLVHALRR
ncbi:AAL044Cp [Eremothecium gossypii ATCC 10895]|uniref:2-dehydropantoate 2-reductase n=1 Tax=Eremothecium gossypii (strain ATCC 10895 / CBS 109.51 / FGSC 9923 / NRRL Y-1056) TaxID=284811 RepID=Q75EX2_EREGS|nr:AAL044Cp [Eremothecium gossypii ATCC 10895]AAS50322.1 AAL044Cp [Eremothecium gossypii ATCC 10895]AEY94608.1 FAAL044Cp [Eremothecium gossypii FDAG1]